MNGYSLPWWHGVVMLRKGVIILIPNILPERPQMAAYCMIYLIEARPRPLSDRKHTWRRVLFLRHFVLFLVGHSPSLLRPSQAGS